uniref:Response regulator n=1 Tax=Roseihalotalea indica TaxID=2867963 RepID=A0AA49GR07_9BACT|nr:response regulator [Tunicatimonas sp. TK19036]
MTCWLIDDNEIDLLVTHKLITSWEPSIEAQEFTDAWAVLDKLKAGGTPPHLILLDLFMPEISGWDFLDHYQPIAQENTLLYVLSSSIDDADIMRARTYDVVNGYLSKPIAKESFQRVVSDFQPSFIVG